MFPHRVICDRGIVVGQRDIQAACRGNSREVRAIQHRCPEGRWRETRLRRESAHPVADDDHEIVYHRLGGQEPPVAHIPTASEQQLLQGKSSIAVYTQSIRRHLNK